MKKNEKGFTLVELLAVIVILGLLMAIAIPSVTKYITQSRKKTLISSVDSYVTAVTTAVNDNEFGAMSKEDTMYYVPVSNDENSSCVSLEKGGTNPFGNWQQAYVVVNYDSDNYSYDYYFTFYDDAGYGMALTKFEDISATGNIITNPSPVNASNITTQKNNMASNIKVLTTNSCKVENALDGGPNVNGNTNNNGGGGNNTPVELSTFYITIGSIIPKTEVTMEKNMTFRDWIFSSYNNLAPPTTDYSSSNVSLLLYPNTNGTSQIMSITNTSTSATYSLDDTITPGESYKFGLGIITHSGGSV